MASTETVSRVSRAIKAACPLALTGAALRAMSTAAIAAMDPPQTEPTKTAVAAPPAIVAAPAKAKAKAAPPKAIAKAAPPKAQPPATVAAKPVTRAAAKRARKAALAASAVQPPRRGRPPKAANGAAGLPEAA